MSIKYLVDVNVLSEPMKPIPNDRVVRWLDQHDAEYAVNPIVLGEIEFGILILPAGRRRVRLASWFDELAIRIPVFPIDTHVASEWAKMLAGLKAKGLTIPVKDSLIAATARSHGLTIATRNTADFRHAGVPLVNPFESSGDNS